jgi:hypothetical protein
MCAAMSPKFSTPGLEEVPDIVQAYFRIAEQKKPLNKASTLMRNFLASSKP